MLNEYLKKYQQMVEGEMGRLFSDKSSPETIRRAMRYSLDAGGKRLRPVLAVAGAEAVGGNAASVMPLACALEMIHTYSLIHDDLPAMDNDDLRRGKPTNHKVFGEAIAILAGDGLVTEAFKLLAANATTIEPARLLSIIADVADAAGYAGMIGGQVVDLESEGKSISLEALKQLHRLKTGRLITVSVASGAKWAGADENAVSAISRYGEAIGLAFQIADDILDIEGSTDDIGKPQGSDEARNKATYPAIMGMEDSKRYAKTLVEEAISVLSGFGKWADPLRLIAEYIVNRRC